MATSIRCEVHVFKALTLRKGERDRGRERMREREKQKEREKERGSERKRQCRR